jgi:hypothetical protein
MYGQSAKKDKKWAYKSPMLDFKSRLKRLKGWVHQPSILNNSAILVVLNSAS